MRGVMSTRAYFTDLNDSAWAWIAPYLPAARSGGRPAHDRPSCRPQRHLLPAAHRLSVAPAAPRVPTPGYGLPLFPCLEGGGRLGRTPTSPSQAGAPEPW